MAVELKRREIEKIHNTAIYGLTLNNKEYTTI